MWPPLAWMDVPEELVVHIQDFLDRHSYESILINLAVAGIIIFFDIESRNWDAESYSSKGESVPPTPLDPFLRYFPYPLRWTQIRKLTGYVHPMQWCHIFGQ